MTLTEACTELSTYLSMDLDNTEGQTPTAQQLSDQLWKAAEEVYEEVQYHYEDVPFAPQTGDYKFPLFDSDIGTTPQISDVLLHKPTLVYISSLPMLDSTGRPGLWGYREFKESFRDYRTVANGQPYAATVTPDAQLIFNCPWSASAILLEDIFLEGFGCPRRFDGVVDAAAEWVVHPLLRWPTIRRAVPFAAEAFARDPSALAFLDRMEKRAQRDLARFRAISVAGGSVTDSPLLNDPREFMRL